MTRDLDLELLSEIGLLREIAYDLRVLRKHLVDYPNEERKARSEVMKAFNEHITRGCLEDNPYNPKEKL
jgi:hypothetical protein